MNRKNTIIRKVTIVFILGGLALIACGLLLIAVTRNDPFLGPLYLPFSFGIIASSIPFFIVRLLLQIHTRYRLPIIVLSSVLFLISVALVILNILQHPYDLNLEAFSCTLPCFCASLYLLGGIFTGKGKELAETIKD
jgi:ABC-type Fe3+-siderophore transport system permease subunit